MPPKIVLIGAGSVVFARRLLQDVACVPELSDADVALMDIDEERLEIISRFARKLFKDMRTNVRVESYTDRLAALEDADYVLTTIRVGDDYRHDIGIPLKYGVDQSVGDTIGPGGVFKALRTVPVLLDVCFDIEKVAPNATLLNYTNPMAIASWAISDATSGSATASSEPPSSWRITSGLRGTRSTRGLRGSITSPGSCGSSKTAKTPTQPCGMHSKIRRSPAKIR